MKKILVIEDEARTRNLFLNCLETEGFYTIGAEDGVIGVQQAREQMPDVVICDIKMPKLDGYGVLDTLRQDSITAMIPFIFLTAKTSKAELRQGMELGADDYLTKPCTVEELLGSIAARLEKQTVFRQWCAAECQRVSEPLPTDTAASSAGPESVPPISQVFDFIKANYHQPITLSDVAKAVGYSPAYLTDLMRRQTGQTVHQWIVERRMAKACSLLLETNQSVDQIAEAVGYQYVGGFFRQFRISFGTTPQVWRTAHRMQSGTNQN